MLRLREHPLEDALEPPPPPEAPEPTDETPAPDEPRSPVRRSDGTPIGLRAYCELVTPAWNWSWAHLVALDEVLDKVIAGELTRVIIECPPRIGKTEKATVRLSSYALELEPTWPLLVSGYNEKFAKRLSRKIRRIVSGRVPLSSDRNAAEDWETEAGGGVRAVGTGVGIAGLPAKLILVDDPTKNRKDAYSQAHRDAVWEWFTEDVYTRLEPDGAIVITAARRHEDDLIGRILASEDAANWTVIRLPALAEADDPLGRPEGAAICPDRFTEADYARIKRLLGSASFAALYQQTPVPAEGLIFQQDWFSFYTTKVHPIIENGHAVPTLPDVFNAHVQSWDMSFKDGHENDFVSGLTGSRLGSNIYLRDRVHARMDFPKTITAVRDAATKWPEAKLKLVEDKANGPAVVQTLRNKIAGLVAITPEGDKVSRAHAVTHLCEAGQVWLPHRQIAPWVDAFLHELVTFPNAAHDDDVDAFTQLLLRFDRQITGAMDEEPPKGEKSEAAQIAGMRF
jgi:predicted phage terminase large subunit-like protein